MDPAILLDETDDFRWAARVAAHRVVMKDREAAHAAAQKQK